MFQPCDLHGSGEEKSAYLPYATGLLIACAFQNETVKANYAIKRFIYAKEEPDALIAGLDHPAVVGFSTYVWNFEYNKACAKKIKEKYPDCITVFGGHSIEVATSRQLEEYPFMDFIIHGEGEKAFSEILLHHCTDGDYSDIANISYRNNGTVIKTRTEPNDTLDYPSPYLEGYFDDIVNDDVIFSALIETNRGCPYRCAYCDWGSVKQKLRQFPIERTVAEMRWLAEHKIEFCFCIDSNFGIYKKDYEIVDEFLKIKAETGYPEMFKCCATDSNEKEQFNIYKKLNDCKMLKGASLALQTLTPEVLKNIGRKNISLEDFKRRSSMYSKAGIPTYTELILGLPGESYDTFADSINTMLEAGTPKSCFIYFCEFLPNALMGSPEFVKKYQIKTAKMPYTQYHSEPEKGIIEYSNIIISTNTMDYDAWIKSAIFGLVIQSLHFMGITQYAAKYLFLEHGVSYRTFYEKLIDHAFEHKETVLGKCIGDIYYKLSAEKRGEYISRVHIDPAFDNIEYQLEEGLVLDVIRDYKRFSEEITPLLRSFLPEDEIYADLLRYQYEVVRQFGETEKEASFDYDFNSYFNDISFDNYTPLVKRANTLRFTNLYPSADLKEYAKANVWYGRKQTKTVYMEKEVSYK